MVGRSSPRFANRAALGPLLLFLVVAASLALNVALVLPRIADRLPHPWRPSAEAQFPPASECATCHPTEAQAWQVSSHARSAQDPLVHASICGRCHAPVGTQIDPLYQLNLYNQTPMPGMPSSAGEGITCITCHAPTQQPEQQTLTFTTEWPNWRTTDLALQILAFDKAIGPFGTGTSTDPTPVANSSHPSLADPNINSAELCKPCHNVVVDKGPFAPHCGFEQPRVLLLTTYDEWLAGPYAKAGQTCQSCHMPRDQQPGPAAVAPPGTTYDQPLPDRPLANHTITGVSTEYLTSGPAVDREEERAAARVKGAATLDLRLPDSVTTGGPLDVSVVTTNTGAGHELPTGFAYWSETWLEVTATDANGLVVLTSGDTDAEGWLRDEFNPRVRSGALTYDAYLVSLRARLVSVGPNRADWLQPDGTIRIPPDEIPHNLNSTPIIGTADYAVDPILRQLYPGAPLPAATAALQEGYVLRFADTIVRNGIRPQQARQAHYRADLAPGVKGPIRVSARLLIRSLWPWMLTQQEELPTPRPRLPIYEIATARQSVAVTTP
jgi:hypothetical protein